MSQERVGIERLSPSEVYRRNILKTQDELLGAAGIDNDTKNAIKSVATSSLSAIDSAKKCETIDSLDALIHAENIGTLLKERVKAKIEGKPLPVASRIQIHKQVHDMILYARNGMIYELANTCNCSRAR